ncbi:MAG: hypothetical protein K6G90_11050 [Clostridia bacterium]|nr:hypothetical protein [Clostridia bacterium]
MPDIKEMLAERQDLQPVLEILELLGQDTDTITGDALSVIGPERTEQIIRILLTAYNDRICDVINQKLGKKQDMVRISEIMIL